MITIILQHSFTAYHIIYHGNFYDRKSVHPLYASISPHSSSPHAQIQFLNEFLSSISQKKSNSHTTHLFPFMYTRIYLLSFKIEFKKEDWIRTRGSILKQLGLGIYKRIIFNKTNISILHLTLFVHVILHSYRPPIVDYTFAFSNHTQSHWNVTFWNIPMKLSLWPGVVG